MRFFLLLALLISVGIIIFTTQNQTDITLTFFGNVLTYPLPVMLGLPFFIGAIAGMGLIIPIWLKKGKTVKQQKKRIHELETEIVSLAEQTKKEEPQVAQIEQESTEDKTS